MYKEHDLSLSHVQMGNPIVLYCLMLFSCFRQYLAVIFCVVRGHASAIKWLDLHCARFLVSFIERNNYKNNYLDNYIQDFSDLWHPLTIYQANIGQMSLLVSMPCTRLHFTRSKRDATQLERFY